MDKILAESNFMKIAKLFLLLVVIFFSVTFGFLLGRQNGVSVSAQKKSSRTAKSSDLPKKLKTEKIKEIKTLEIEENYFYAVIRQTDEPVDADPTLKTSDLLTIYDESGKTIYEYRDFGLSSIKAVSLTQKSRQIMFETNGGGTDDFLKIIEYKNGGFGDLIAESETQFRGGYFTIPQYRSGGKTPYFNPAQLIVIQQLGGGDENPAASVFRTKDNKFQKVGTVKMQELGDFIENQLAKNKSAE